MSKYNKLLDSTQEIQISSQAEEREKIVGLKYDNNRKKEEVETLRQNREERKKYSKWIFWLLVGYVFVVMFLLYFCGFKLTIISDTVLVTLLSTTTVNMIGIFLVVTKYLFSK